MDARKGVLGHLAIPIGKAPRLNFSVPECFSKELAWWKGFAISNFLNFRYDVFYSRQPSSERWLDIVFQGRYLPTLSINPQNNDLENASTIAALVKMKI